MATGSTHQGKICVWLFKRRLNVLGVPIDTPFVNADLSGLTWLMWRYVR